MPLLSQFEQADCLLTLQAEVEPLAPIGEKQKQIGTFLGDGSCQGTPAQACLIQAACIQNPKSASSTQLIGNPPFGLYRLDHLQLVAYQPRKQSRCVGTRITHQNDSSEPLRQKNLFDRPQFRQDSVLQWARQFGYDGLESVGNGEKSLVIHQGEVPARARQTPLSPRPDCHGQKPVYEASALSSCVTCSVGFTFFRIAFIFRSGPMRYVVLSVPMYFFPYMLFSAHTPYAFTIFWSEKSMYGKKYMGTERTTYL